MRDRTKSSWPDARSVSQNGAVTRLCQTIASATARPVARSQTTAVSRWLVIPIAATRSGAADRGDHLVGRRDLGLPDRLRIVAHVARPGVVLLELALGDGDDAAGVVDGDRPGARRALVEGEDDRLVLDAGAHGTANSRRAPSRNSSTSCAWRSSSQPSSAPRIRRDPGGDRRSAVRQLVGQAHPARQHVVDGQGQLVAGRPGDLDLEMLLAVDEAAEEPELAPERDHVGGLRPVTPDEPRRHGRIEPAGRRQRGAESIQLGPVGGADQPARDRSRGPGRLAGAEDADGGVDRLLGHEPVGRVLAAAHADQPVGLHDDPMLA